MLCTLPLLNRLAADCLPAPDPPNKCLCCTECCDRESRQCGLPEPINGPYKDYLAQFFGDVVYETDNAYDRAIQWIIYEDPLQLQADSDDLVQRYILAFFYFHTSEANPWISCNPQVEGETMNCTYQKIVQRSDDGVAFESVESARWLSGVPECQWAGVLCDSIFGLYGIEVGVY